MSSHHIIRENQEPALVLTIPLRMELLRELCEWSPKIYADYSLCDWIIEAQIKIDVLFGPEANRVAIENKLKYQWPFEYIRLERVDQIIHLIDNESVNLATEKGIDDFKALDKSLVIYTNKYKEYSFQREWRKWKNEGAYVEIGKPEQIDAISNLHARNEGYYVIKNGICRLRTSGRNSLREFF